MHLRGGRGGSFFSGSACEFSMAVFFRHRRYVRTVIIFLNVFSRLLYDHSIQHAQAASVLHQGPLATTRPSLPYRVALALDKVKLSLLARARLARNKVQSGTRSEIELCRPAFVDVSVRSVGGHVVLRKRFAADQRLVSVYVAVRDALTSTSSSSKAEAPASCREASADQSGFWRSAVDCARPTRPSSVRTRMFLVSQQKDILRPSDVRSLDMLAAAELEGIDVASSGEESASEAHSDDNHAATSSLSAVLATPATEGGARMFKTSSTAAVETSSASSSTCSASSSNFDIPLALTVVAVLPRRPGPAEEGAVLIHDAVAVPEGPEPPLELAELQGPLQYFFDQEDSLTHQIGQQQGHRHAPAPLDEVNIEPFAPYGQFTDDHEMWQAQEQRLLRGFELGMIPPEDYMLCSFRPSVLVDEFLAEFGGSCPLFYFGI